MKNTKRQLDYGLEDQGIRFLFPEKIKGLSLHNVQTVPEVHLTSYTSAIGTGGYFPESKVVRV
jgi:hypothetical protein